MAGSAMTFATTRMANNIKKLSATWTSDDTTGAVSGSPGVVTGDIVKTVTVPSGGGTAPTTLYDIALLDSDGGNLFAGTNPLLDRSATVTETVNHRSSDAVSAGGMTISIANAGNSKQGVVHVYYQGWDS